MPRDTPSLPFVCRRTYFLDPTSPAVWTSAAVIPLKTSGRTDPAGYLILGISPRREFDNAYRRFYELVGNHVATMVTNARAYEDERRRTEALAELDRAKTAFFSNVSHEFRTPLTLMLGPIEDLLAKSDTDLSPSARGQLEIVKRNGLRLLRLVNNLLDFSRIEAGRIQSRYEPVDLATFTAELAGSFRSATQRAGLELIVQCPPLSERVYIDREMWEKIVLNLLSNAFKFTFEGQIVVRLRQCEGAAELVVQDTGVGIPAEALPQLFERFYRVDNIRSRTHEGSGIGLALIQELVKLHGGTVRAESTIGKGSSFTITIPFGCSHLPADKLGAARTLPSTALGTRPFVEEALRWLPDEASSEPEQPALNEDAAVLDRNPLNGIATDQARILVVDDNADMRQYVARLLSEWYQVETAADGHAALAVARARRPDLVLSDVTMPKLDGFGLIRELRSDPLTESIPVILLLARAGEESRVEGLEQSADDYLIKPFSAWELLARVRAHLKLARVRQDAQRERSRLQDELQLILDNAPAMIWFKDTQNRILRVNRQAADSIALPKDRIEGRSVADLYPDHADRYYQDDLVVMETRAPRLGIIEPYLLGTGERRWIRTDKLPIKNDRDEVVAILVFAQDITEQRQTEEALCQSERRLKRVLETDAVGIIFFDHGGTVINANDVFLRQTGYRREQIDRRALHWRSLTPLEWIETSERQMEQFVQTGRIGPYEKEYFLADGSRRWMLFAGRDLGDGTIAEYCIDIHDRKEAQLRLEQFSMELERQVTVRTAELRESQEHLRALATELNLAEQRERKRLAVDLHDYLQQILVLGKLTLGQSKREMPADRSIAESINKVDNLLSDALSYTRTLVAELSPPVLRDHGLVAGIKWLAEEMKKHELTVAIHILDSAEISLPEDQVVLLFQSVRELLLNASKHAKTEHVSVSLTQQQTVLRIVVSDRGAGFDVPAVAGSPHRGLSARFGLFSIKERMRALGGSFEIQSAPDKGTTATLILPLIQPGTGMRRTLGRTLERVPAALAAQTSPSTKNDTIRLVLVDDHAMVRQGLRAILEGYAELEVVAEAGDGQEAIAVVDRLRPNMVIMDVNMPMKNGIEATREIKARFPYMGVIGISVNASGDSEQAMLRAGASVLLTKEAAVEHLYVTIRNLMKTSA